MYTTNNNAVLLTAYETMGEVGINEYIEMFIDEIEYDPAMAAYYNDYLSENNRGDDYIYTMDMFDEIMDGCDPWEIARSAFYGDFRPCDDYFGFNGYGNLVSFDEYMIEKKIMEDKDFLEWYIKEENLIDEDEARETIEKANELIKKGW